MKKKLFLMGLSVFLITGCSININIGGNTTDNNTTNNTASNVVNEIVNDLKTSVNPSDFVGSWSSQRPTVDVTKEANNTYKFLVHWGSSATEYSQWEYTCNFDETNGLMNCTGSKADYEDGKLSLEYYTDGKATFTLGSDGKLYWNDAKEDAGNDISFEKGE